jgi:hypothetical protein
MSNGTMSLDNKSGDAISNYYFVTTNSGQQIKTVAGPRLDSGSSASGRFHIPENLVNTFMLFCQDPSGNQLASDGIVCNLDSNKDHTVNVTLGKADGGFYLQFNVDGGSGTTKYPVQHP